MHSDYPILEFDSARQAVINPELTIQRRDDLPESCVLCFFQEVIGAVANHDATRVAHHLGSEVGKSPVYVIDVDGKPLTVTHPGVGAPFSAAVLEEMIALGCRKFIACGGAGTLQPGVQVGHLVVPTSAVRDEGTSYHYLPPAREVTPSPEAVAVIESVLQADGAPYLLGKTWTTDGIYRETPGKVALRRDEGCLTVEMEAAAFFAVAQFRGVTFGQILYCGDDVSSDEWDSRHWDKQTSVREKLFWLAAEACLKL